MFKTKKKCGGRGFLNAKTLHNREVCSLREYLLKSDVGMHRDMVAVDKGLTPLSLANENWRKPVVLTTHDRKGVWQSKQLHGRFFGALHGHDVDFNASVAWLRFGDLFGETEGFVTGDFFRGIGFDFQKKHKKLEKIDEIFIGIDGTINII